MPTELDPDFLIRTRGVEPPPAPRPVRLGALLTWNMGFGFIWGLGYGGIPAVILVVMALAMGSPLDDWALDQRGRRAVATVTAVEGTGTSVNDESVMRVSLRFRDVDDREQTASYTTTTPPPPGAPVDLEYDPQAPRVARPRGGYVSILSEQRWVPIMLIGAFILPGGLTFLWASWRLWQRRKLYVHGTAAQGRIERLTESSSSENDVPVMIAHYAFTANGQRFAGEHKASSLPALHDRVWVIYDPADPAQSLLCV